MKFSTATRLTSANLAIATALISAPVFAQDADDVEPVTTAPATADNAIVVTGSRIVRPETEGAAPLIAAIGEEELETRGFTNVSDALNEVPGFGTPVSSAGGQAGFSVGQNFVNLFGIGSQRTLTLVNGRRFVSSNTASNFGGASAGLQVDLNVIPVSLVDRIDVLAVKGATTYGSDAVAGTVNLVLKDDFEGLEATAQYGIFEEGYGESYSASVTAGGNFADGRGNIAVNVEYNRQEGVLLLDTPYGQNDLFVATENELVYNRRIGILTAGGLPSTGNNLGFLTNANGDTVQFDVNGNLVPYDFGTATTSVVNWSGGDGLNLNRSSQVLSDLERYTLFALGHYDLTDNVRFFFEANYANTEAVELANQPVYQSALFGGDSRALGVLASNPFLTDQARDVVLSNYSGPNFDRDGDGVNDETRFFIQRAGFDLLGGSNPNFQQLDLFRGVAGLEGDFQVMDRDFFWNASYSYGRSQAVSSSTALVQANFLNAVDAVRDPDTGEIVCRVTLDTPPPLGSGQPNTPEQQRAISDCVPLNLFGEGVASPEAIDFVTAETLAESRNIQQIFNVNVGGGLFDLFSNEVAFNIGYEHRRERQTFTPDAFLQEGLGRSVAIAPVDGSFNTNEYFGEILVPIIQPYNDTFIHALEFDASARYIDNSIAGSDWVWSVGGQLAPIEDITFRGSYTESVRAPAITELFLPGVSVFSFADDPCDERFIDSGDFPGIRAANCAADGIPTGFRSVIVDASQEITSSGNPNLVNETSESWTVGAILQPRFIPGLTATVDWVDIELTNAITTLDLTDVLRSCYDNPNFPNVPTCNQFTRGPDGNITGALVGQSNAGSFEYAGLQASVRYGFNPGDLFADGNDAGDLDLVLRYFYLDKSQFTVVGVLDRNAGEIGNYKHEVNGTIRYTYGPFMAAFTGNYRSGASFDLQEDQTAPYAKVGDYFIMDATLGFDITDNVTAQLTVNNLLNSEPPFPSFSTTQYTDGFLGREYLFRLRSSF
mgnify:CR=1 FL=1